MDESGQNGRKLFSSKLKIQMCLLFLDNCPEKCDEYCKSGGTSYERNRSCDVVKNCCGTECEIHPADVAGKNILCC